MELIMEKSCSFAMKLSTIAGSGGRKKMFCLFQWKNNMLFLCLSIFLPPQSRYQSAARGQLAEQGPADGAVAVAVDIGNPVRAGRAAGVVQQRVQGRPAAEPTDGGHHRAAGGLCHAPAGAGVAALAAGQNRSAGAGAARGGRPERPGHPPQLEPAAREGRCGEGGGLLF